YIAFKKAIAEEVVLVEGDKKLQELSALAAVLLTAISLLRGYNSNARDHFPGKPSRHHTETETYSENTTIATGLSFPVWTFEPGTFTRKDITTC
ncbi:hypothetical protein BGX27_002574, partial [Mortierella sp. AM989]